MIYIIWQCFLYLWAFSNRRKVRNYLLKFLPYISSVCVCVCVAQSCPTLCNPMNYSPPDSRVYGVLWARILEWVAIPFSRGSSQPTDQIQISCMASRFFCVCVMRTLRICPLKNFMYKLQQCFCIFSILLNMSVLYFIRYVIWVYFYLLPDNQLC